MRRKSDKARDRMINFRVTVEEHLELIAATDQSGARSLGDYVRSLVLGARRARTIEDLCDRVDALLSERVEVGP